MISLSWRIFQNQVRQNFGRGLASMDPSWKPPVPCQVGDGLKDIDTPALLINLDKMQENLGSMSRIMQAYPGVNVRPHTKAHKCPPIAKLQMEHGAVGVCCQTLVECEAVVYGADIKDVFLTNQIIGKAKLHRFTALAKHARMSICVDSFENLREISDVAREMNVNIDCVVEVNVGQERCGVEPGNPAAALAQEVLILPNVTFKGLHCYHGLNQHIRSTDDRERAVQAVAEKVKISTNALKEKGIPCDYVTGGGTGSFKYEAKSGVFTEVQPGSYIVMDGDYSKNLGEDGRPARDFQSSLFVLSTVQSVAESTRAVLDAGMKAVSMDSGVPLLWQSPELVYNIGGDEHGVVKPPGVLKVGDLVWLVPGHCDPTVNLHDYIIGIRHNKVVAVWPILGRGPGV